MQEQVGFKRLEEELKVEAAQWSHLLPQLPRLLHQRLRHHAPGRALAELRRLRRRRSGATACCCASLAGALAIMAAWAFFGMPLPGR